MTRNDEVQEVMTTTIVNSSMLDELAEIDQTPHASLLAHSEQKEEIEAGFESADKAANDWNLPEDRVPTPQKQPDKPTEVLRYVPTPSCYLRYSSEACSCHLLGGWVCSCVDSAAPWV